MSCYPSLRGWALGHQEAGLGAHSSLRSLVHWLQCCLVSPIKTRTLSGLRRVWGQAPGWLAKARSPS